MVTQSNLSHAEVGRGAATVYYQQCAGHHQAAPAGARDLMEHCIFEIQCVVYKEDANDPVWFALKLSESMKISFEATVAAFLNVPTAAYSRLN